MAELTRRYIVMTLATEAPFDTKDADAPFVLKPWKDPAALRALETYRDHCYQELARELEEWIKQIKAGPSLRGGVGSRNEEYLKIRTEAKRGAARSSAKPVRRRSHGKAKPKAKKSILLKRKRK